MLLFKNATLMTMEEDHGQTGDLLTENGRIRAIGKSLEAPGGARVIDAAGCLLCPGLIDAHNHVGLFLEGAGPEGTDVNEQSDPVTPHLRAIDGVNPSSRAFAEALSAGVTAVMTGPGSANVAGGQFALLKTWGLIVDDMVVRSPAASKVAFGENPKQLYGAAQKKAPYTRMANAAMLRELLFKAKEYAVRIETARAKNEPPPPFDMKLDSLLPVMGGEIPLKCHAHTLFDMFTAIRIAREFGLSFTLDHCTEAHLAPHRLAKEIEFALIGPSFGFRSKLELKEKTFATARILYEAGIKPVIITDAPIVPIEYLPLCAGLAVKSGLPEDEAWKAVTKYPAQALGVYDRLGSLQAGKDADLALYRGNPLRDLDSYAALTVVNGEIVHEA